MKRKVIGLFGIMVCIVGYTAAQTSSFSDWQDTSATHPIQVISIDTWVWKVSHPFREKISYLYAILPEVPGDLYELPPFVKSLGKETEKLVMAIDPERPPRDVIHRVEVPLDSTLELLLPYSTYQELQQWVEDSLSSLSAYKLEKRYPASVLARQFLGDYCLDPRQGQKSEMLEYNLKRELDLPLEVVGTGWTRIAWLDSYSYKEQAWHLVEVMHKRQALCEIYQAMIRAYYKGDIDRVWLLSQSAPDLGYNFGRLLEARNQAWLRYLKLNLPYQSLFIAINAAQLPGEYGLIHQLRNEGYILEPVR